MKRSSMTAVESVIQPFNYTTLLESQMIFEDFAILMLHIQHDDN